MWEVKKPDKDGIWLWRLPDKKHHGTGVVRMYGNKIEELGTSPTVTYDLNVWWGIFPVETFYVDGA